MTRSLRNARMKLDQGRGQIFWREVSQGTVLVFLHGSWTDSSQWLPVLEHLGAGYHCLIPDLPGFGESRFSKVHYSIDAEVEWLAEYFEALRLKQIYLVGHSVGGWIAASYALKYPHQVQGLVLLSPEGVQPSEMAGRWTLARWLMGQPPVLYGLLKLLRPVSKALKIQVTVEAWLQLRQQMRRSPTACKLLFQRRTAEIKSELLQERLDWLKTPTLILQGQEDAPIALAMSQTYALAPDAELHLIPDISHDLPHAAPELLAQHLQKFVTP